MTKLSIHQRRAFALLAAGMLCNTTLNAQLKLSSIGASTTAVGPTVANQTATFYNNTTGTTYVAYTPTTTVTLSVSNQQFTNIPVQSGQSAGTGVGLSIGAKARTNYKAVKDTFIYDRMSTIGSPVNSSFTATSSSATGTGIDVANNYGFVLFTATEGLASYNNGGTARATNGRHRIADLTVAFNRPVNNPVLHIVGLGGSYINGSTYTQGFSTELDLISTNVPTGVTLTKLSGDNGLAVASNSIKNSWRPLSGTCGTSAACGSVLVSGNSVVTLTFRVYIQGDGLGSDWSSATNTALGAGNLYTGDRWAIGASLAASDVVLLPAVGLNLSGVRSGNDISLKWTTLTEQNTASFRVERSYDGRNFTSVGTVQASGYSTSQKTYTLTDRNVSKDVAYYRIVLLDADGRQTISNTAVVRLSAFAKGNRIFPNPVENHINVEFVKSGTYQVAVYSNVGQALINRTVAVSNGQISSIDRKGLPSGNYVVKVTEVATNESESFKVILK